jgi:hypothetical protein
MAGFSTSGVELQDTMFKGDKNKYKKKKIYSA